MHTDTERQKELAERFSREYDKCEEMSGKVISAVLSAYDLSEEKRDLLRIALSSVGFRRLEEFAAQHKAMEAAFVEWTNA